MDISKYRDFFIKGDNRSSLMKRNIIGSFILRGGNILISFLLIPLTIGLVSSEIYGVWLTIYSIVQWIGLFDIGFGNGLRNRITEAVAHNNFNLARQYISVTYACLSIIFIPLSVVIIFIIPLVDWASLLNVSQILVPEIIKSTQIVAFFLGFTMIIKIQSTIFSAMQYNAVASLFDTLGQGFVLAVILVLSYFVKGSLIVLAVVLSICPLLSALIGTWWLFKIRYPYLKPQFGTIKWNMANDILNLGVKFFIIQIATLVLYSAVNVLISHVSGPNEVTEYNVIHKYLSIPYMIFGIMIAPLWSAYTDAYAKQDFEWMTKVYRKMFRIMLMMLCVLTVLVLVHQIFFKIWLGESVKIHFTMILIVAIYIAEMIWSNLNAFIINGIGKVNLQLLTSIIITILNIPLALLLGEKFGSEGILASTCLLNAMPMVILNIQVNKILNNRATGIWNK